MAEPGANEIQEDDDLELKFLLSGPTNESNMYELLGGTFSTITLLRNTDDEPFKQEILPDNKDDFAEPSMLGSVRLSRNNSQQKAASGWFLATWPRGRRGSRIRSRIWSAEISHLFGSPKPPSCGRTISGGRKKTKRWTYLEAEKLVDGVYEYGVGNWTALKRTYFKASFRTPVQLKDKWRDFVRACGIQVGSKKQVHAQRATGKIIKGLKKKIVSIYRKHAAENRRA